MKATPQPENLLVIAQVQSAHVTKRLLRLSEYFVMKGCVVYVIVADQTRVSDVHNLNNILSKKSELETHRLSNPFESSRAKASDNFTLSGFSLANSYELWSGIRSWYAFRSVKKTTLRTALSIINKKQIGHVVISSCHPSLQMVGKELQRKTPVSWHVDLGDLNTASETVQKKSLKRVIRNANTILQVSDEFLTRKLKSSFSNQKENLLKVISRLELVNLCDYE